MMIQSLCRRGLHGGVLDELAMQQAYHSLSNGRALIGVQQLLFVVPSLPPSLSKHYCHSEAMLLVHLHIA